MAGERDRKSSATLKNILDDLHRNNTDEEIKIILSQQDNVETNVGNTSAQNYVEEIKSNIDQQMTGMKFYMEYSLTSFKRNSIENMPISLQKKDTLDIQKSSKETMIIC